MNAGRAFTIARGIVYAVLFVSLWTWVAASVRRFDAGLAVTIPRALAPLGYALCAAGLVIGVACVAEFVTRGQGTPAPFDPPRVFVASGPYRYVRNPMYVGGVAALAGAGLIVRSASILVLALIFLVIAHLLVVLYEEGALVAKFGDSYREYQRSVHRWLIRWPRAPR